MSGIACSLVTAINKIDSVNVLSLNKLFPFRKLGYAH